MQIGYARVSSTDQNLDRQLKQFEGLGIKKIFAEKISGKDRSRPKLREMLQYIHDDDEVVVTSLDRLGRNSQDLTTIIEEIRSKGAVINILDLPTFDGVQDKNLKALLSNLVMEIYKYTAEEERKKIKSRQREGIDLSKARGVYQGSNTLYSATSKNPKYRVLYEKVVSLLKKNTPIVEIYRQTGVSRMTIYKIKREMNVWKALFDIFKVWYAIIYLRQSKKI